MCVIWLKGVCFCGTLIIYIIYIIRLLYYIYYQVALPLFPCSLRCLNLLWWNLLLMREEVIHKTNLHMFCWLIDLEASACKLHFQSVEIQQDEVLLLCSSGIFWPSEQGPEKGHQASTVPWICLVWGEIWQSTERGATIWMKSHNALFSNHNGSVTPGWITCSLPQKLQCRTSSWLMS